MSAAPPLRQVNENLLSPQELIGTQGSWFEQSPSQWSLLRAPGQGKRRQEARRTERKRRWEKGAARGRVEALKTTVEGGGHW